MIGNWTRGRRELKAAIVKYEFYYRNIEIEFRTLLIKFEAPVDILNSRIKCSGVLYSLLQCLLVKRQMSDQCRGLWTKPVILKWRDSDLYNSQPHKTCDTERVEHPVFVLMNPCHWPRYGSAVIEDQGPLFRTKQWKKLKKKFAVINTLPVTTGRFNNLGI